MAAHWMWGEDGWLIPTPFHDFAGAGAVHIVAGMMALVGTALLGPRIGRFENTEEGPVVRQIPGHSTPVSSKLPKSIDCCSCHAM